MGYLAAPCRMLLNESDLVTLFRDLAKRSEHMYCGTADHSEESISQLPSFVDAIANTVQASAETSSLFITTLERMTMALFGSYHLLQAKLRRSALSAFARVCCFLILEFKGIMCIHIRD